MQVTINPLIILNYTALIVVAVTDRSQMRALSAIAVEGFQSCLDPFIFMFALGLPGQAFCKFLCVTYWLQSTTRIQFCQHYLVVILTTHILKIHENVIKAIKITVVI